MISWGSERQSLGRSHLGGSTTVTLFSVETMVVPAVESRPSQNQCPFSLQILR